MNINPSVETSAAKQKLAELLDPGSFMEIGEHVSARFTEFYKPDTVIESDGVMTGYGTIDGNLVFVYAQDSSVMGGTFSEQHGRKIVNLYEHALKAKAPVIGLLDCAGFRIEEGLDGLDQFAKLYKCQSKAAGIIPQIMAVVGQCGGGMSISAQLGDFLFIEKDKGSIFVNSQKVVDNAIGNNSSVEPSFDGTYEWSEIVSKIQWLIDVLPPSSDFYSGAEEVSIDSLNRTCDTIISKRGDAKAILAELSDDDFVLELKSDSGNDMVTGFIKIGGQPIGVVACNTVGGQKRISAEGCEKAASIIEICNKFNVPVLTITDTEGYETTSESEKYLAAAAGRLLRALTTSDVPKINLITGSVAGSAYSLLNSKGLSADYVFMWDDASVSIVNSKQATEIIYGEYSADLEKKYVDTQSSAIALARHGLVDKIIAPEESRKYIIGALQTFVNSR